ncbi:TPA: Vir protein [Legionella pneumophila]|nr:Vir protein [Legionella pneumophila]HAT3828192.1 Vir protein [Legionella pneumophila]HAU1392241.1 Vir protein [Legionella pneumophila]HAU2129207.1 Vir protein [Legionella pneumophila]HAU3984403.1 Vir protein [Legionella pneumophila]
MKFDVELYINARKQIEKKFQLLPYGPRLIIYELLNLANPFTGIVSDISYRDLSRSLEIKTAPGRINSGVPSKQTIRNFIKSIEHECGEYFQVITEGQNLKFIFPEVPKIYDQLIRRKEFNTDLNSPKSLIDSDREGDLEAKSNVEVNREANTLKNSAKNINIFNITNSNKQTDIANNDFCRSKKQIDDNFYPNAKTIEIAFSMGLTKVTDFHEIQAFIKHNKKQNTQWADFNPVFINWLERDAQYTQNKQQKAQGQLRSHHNERGTNQSTLHQTPLQRVSEQHGISIESLWGNSGDELNSGAFIEGTLVQALDETDCNLRTAFY